MTTPAPAPPPPRGPLLLLGLLSILSFGGPFLILLVIRGGPRPEWPPDRPVEWWTLAIVGASVPLLMTACVVAGLRARPRPPAGP